MNYAQELGWNNLGNSEDPQPPLSQLTFCCVSSNLWSIPKAEWQTNRGSRGWHDQKITVSKKVSGSEGGGLRSSLRCLITQSQVIQQQFQLDTLKERLRTRSTHLWFQDAGCFRWHLATNTVIWTNQNYNTSVGLPVSSIAKQYYQSGMPPLKKRPYFDLLTWFSPLPSR